jgi:hypothetical protein
MLTVKEPMLSPAGTVAAPDAAADEAPDDAGAAALELDELDELLQAAAVRATTAATIDTAPSRR